MHAHAASRANSTARREPRRFDLVPDRRQPEGLAGLDGVWRKQFGRTVTLALDAYNTRYSALAVLDGRSLTYRVCRGFAPATAVPELDLALGTLHSPDGILIADTREDPRTAHLECVRRGARRFYAGRPIHTILGEPVAVLSVFDRAARPPGDQALSLLGNLAMACEQRLHEVISRSGASD